MTKKKDLDICATGRRKSAIARVHMRLGCGKVHVNGRPEGGYFVTLFQKQMIRDPIELCHQEGKDFFVSVFGGGLEGQAMSVRHAIARAIVKFDKDHRKILKDNGFLTRDPRKRERKKYGRAGARKSFQFSKR